MQQTYEEFVEQHSQGWCVVYIGRAHTPSKAIFANVIGLFPTQAEAIKRANRMRAKYRRQDRQGNAPSDMIRVSVRPVWNTDTEE